MSDGNISTSQEVKCFGYPATLQFTIPEPMQASLNLSRKTPLLLRVLKKDKVFRFFLTLGNDNFQDMKRDPNWESRGVEQIVVQEKGSVTIPKHIMHAAKLNGYTFFNASLSDGPNGEKRIMLDPDLLDELPQQTKSHLERNKGPIGKYGLGFKKIKPFKETIPLEEIHLEDSAPEAEIAWQVEIPHTALRITNLRAGKILIPDSALTELGWNKGSEISFYVLDTLSTTRKYIVLASVKERQEMLYPFSRDRYKQVGSSPVGEARFFSNTLHKPSIDCTGTGGYSEIILESDTKGNKILVIYG